MNLSEADIAFKKFKQHVASKVLENSPFKGLSEADTRAKLIDPIFKEVLGWPETEIKREESANDGFADYSFGLDYIYYHVEAKRAEPAFKVNASRASRILQLKGPHLLGNKEIKVHLEQTARYSSDLGSEYAILTNGYQFLVFKTRVPGKSWREGRALIWHDWADIEENFAEFYSLLSRTDVKKGSLETRFSSAEEITTNLYLIREAIPNPDAELVRNSFWQKISSVFTPLLTDQPTSEELQEEIIRNCYVQTPLSDQVDIGINQLLQDNPPKFLSDADVKNIDPAQMQNSFNRNIENDIKNRHINTYILTGGVGSGKTTFLKRFRKVVNPTLVKEYCIWLHVDYLAAGSISEEKLRDQLEEFTYKELRTQLETKYKDFYPANGEELRSLFKNEIESLRMTKLFGVPENSEKWTEIINAEISQLYGNNSLFISRILLNAPHRGRRVVLALDNTDQLGEKFQEQIFLFSQKLSKECRALTIVALREEKFFAAYRSGVFDAYGDRRFHIGSPNLQDVIASRLRYGLKKFQTEGRIKDPTQVKKISTLIQSFINSATSKNQNIVRLLSCVSNGDMRYALGVFRDFVSSGNTDTDKILEKLSHSGRYNVPFHEFAKSAILGNRKYYSSQVSHTANLFLRTQARNSSHLTACRVLARLTNAQNAPSRYGSGFIYTKQLLEEFTQSFGNAQDFVLRGSDLLRRGLIESEPPKADNIEKTDALRISASGAYYWRFLARSFAYLDLVYVDTPLTDKSYFDKLIHMTGLTDLSTRFERVRVFLDYLKSEEQKEINNVISRGGPYTSSLISEIQSQIENEIRLISDKTGAQDLSDAD
nr:hypothetical protein BdHM001_03400 [Bdellovibrio sp. HM001]